MTAAMTRDRESSARPYIDGEWAEPSDGRIVDVINPTTEESIGQRPAGRPGGHRSRGPRRASGVRHRPVGRVDRPSERAAIMTRAGELISERAERLAQTITLEVGSPLRDRRAGSRSPPSCTSTGMRPRPPRFPWEEEREGIRGPMLVRRQPVGVVGAIVPWNFPLALSFPKIAPALLTGCSVVLKPPVETPLFGFLLAEAFEDAGLPPGVLNVVPADRGVGELLVRHPLVDKISFTGSTSAGRRIAALCGEQIKRCSLELGGKSAAIVLPDADLDAVIGDLAPNTMRNNGQTCTNATRVLAHRAPLRGGRRGAAGGDRRLPGRRPRGPGRRRRPARQRRRSASAWRATSPRAATREPGSCSAAAVPTATAATSSSRRSSPTSTTRMTIAQEEIFGPVVCVIPYDDEDHAVAIANDSSYGLSGSVWGPDAEQAKAVARRIHSGTVGVNQHILDPAGPFGGVKQSGLGRENGIEGIDAYVELQTIPYVR